MVRAVAIFALASVGCTAVFGLDSPERAKSDASIGDDVLAFDDAPVDTPAPMTDIVRLVDITDAQVMGGPHANFPVLISTTQPWLRNLANGGDVRRDDGFDIYFSADQAGTTRLAHEMTAYVPTSGTLIAWVKLPMLAPTTSFYIHCGSDQVTTSQQNVAGTWSGDYKLVMHLSGLMDASGNVSGVTMSNVTTGTAAQVGSGMSFNGTTSVIDASSADAVDNLFAAGGTASAWIHPLSFGENNLSRIFDKGGSFGWALYLGNVMGQNGLSFTHTSGADTEAIFHAGLQTIALNEWQHVAVVFDKDQMANEPKLFINGASKNITVIDTPNANYASDDAFAVRIGNNEAGDRTFDGIIDEVRLSSVGRTNAWIATEYRNQSSPATFFTIGPPL